MRTKHVLILALAILGISSLVVAGVTNFDSITLSEDLIVGDDSTLTDDVAIGGDLTVTGAQAFTGNQTLTGNLAVGGTLAVTGAQTFTGNTTASGDLAVTGEVTISDKLNMDIDDSIAWDSGNYEIYPDNATGWFLLEGPDASGFMIYETNLAVGDGTPTVALDSEDAYVEGTFETDGMYYANGGIEVTTSLDLDYATASEAVCADASKLLVSQAGVSCTELGYLSAVTSDIQAQIDLKAPIDNPVFTTEIDIADFGTASELLVTDASSNIVTLTGVSSTEAGYLDGVTSAIQTQMDTKFTSAAMVRAASANQACNTTCSGQCFFGFDTAGPSLVDCASADADECMCES